MIGHLWQRFTAWLQSGRVVLEIQIGARPWLSECHCGRRYVTPPLGVPDSGTCWLHRSAAPEVQP